MNLIVVTHPGEVEDEIKIINNLFDEGLEILHLRKPGYEKQKVANLLMNINNKYHSRIALHQHHELADEFDVQRLHFPSEKNDQINSVVLKYNYEKIYSTSIHRPAEYEKLHAEFSYCFFGPVFNSISKPGYNSVVGKNFKLPEQRKIKVIAIGGVDEDKLEACHKLGFSGIAICGAIWENENPLKKFLKMNSLSQKLVGI